MWKEFRIAVSFLTRLPLPYKGEWDERSFSRSSVFFPLVGLIIGFLTALTAAVFRLTGQTMLAAVAALVTAVVVSGGIHLDGFMDMCDGVFASRGRERALEIMKDSRVGSFAVLGVVMLMLLKCALYCAVLPERWFFTAILAAFVFSRFMMVYCILGFPSARETGLGATVKKYVSKPALLWGLLLFLLLCLWHGFYPLLIAFALAFLVMYAAAAGISRFLYGLTGDIYGAIAELSEAVFLLFLVLTVSVLGGLGLPAALF